MLNRLIPTFLLGLCYQNPYNATQELKHRKQSKTRLFGSFAMPPALLMDAESANPDFFAWFFYQNPYNATQELKHRKQSKTRLFGSFAITGQNASGKTYRRS